MGQQKRRLRDWFLATRPWSFPASGAPALLGVAYGYWRVCQAPPELYATNNSGTEFSWLAAALAIVGAVMFQATSNLINDHYDYQKGIDHAGSYSSSQWITSGRFKSVTIYRYGIILLVIACAIGFGIYFCFGRYYLLFIGAVGILSVILYNNLKYIAWGEVVIFIIYGLMIPFGSAYTASGIIMWEAMLVGVPSGVLIVNILFANNIRDRANDAGAGIKTVAMMKGMEWCRRCHNILISSPYVLLLVLIATGLAPLLSLISFATLGISKRGKAQMNAAAQEGDEAAMRNLDETNAKLVAIFTLIFAVSYLIDS